MSRPDPSQESRENRLAAPNPAADEELLPTDSIPPLASPLPVDLRGLEVVDAPDENLYCPICHSLLVGPVSLPCDHIFCRECLVDAWKHQQGRTQACPSCRVPTSESRMVTAPKIITRILDDIKVRCPLAPVGCPDVLTRSNVENHINRYCGYVVVNCPENDCMMQIERRLASAACLHQTITCRTCAKSTTELDYLRHRRMSCSEEHHTCPGCQGLFPASKFDTHVDDCLDALTKCSATAYGCDYAGKRRDLGEHESTCPLSKLGPFLSQQKSRLDEHERALKHLRLRNEIYEEGLTNLQETLRDSLENSAALAQTSGMKASSSSLEASASHLLELYETLQEELRRVSVAVSDLDAKLELGMLNQAMRVNEEKLHRDAVEGQIRKQLQWLLSSRLQGYQRSGAPVKKPSHSGGTSRQSGITGMSGDSSGSDSETWGASSSPIRRLSDPTRQDTKL